GSAWRCSAALAQVRPVGLPKSPPPPSWLANCPWEPLSRTVNSWLLTKLTAATGPLRRLDMKRPFKGLSRGNGPLRDYDAVVIGAGVGGLTCANLLAREGLRVLLAEQHYVAGGCVSTFHRQALAGRVRQGLAGRVRQGYTFDAASHFYPLLGN